jgi:hypothetical protein
MAMAEYVFPDPLGPTKANLNLARDFTAFLNSNVMIQTLNQST